jgi:hypothetical protein
MARGSSRWTLAAVVGVAFALGCVIGLRGCDVSAPPPSRVADAHREVETAPAREPAASTPGESAPRHDGAEHGQSDPSVATAPPAPGRPADPGHRKRRERRQRERPQRASHGAVFESPPGMPIATASPLEVHDLAGLSGRGTVAFWLSPQWAQGNQDDASLVRIGGGLLQINKNVSFLRFEFLGVDGAVGGVGVPIGTWAPGEWHHVAATWDTGVLVLYVDGVLVSQKTFVGEIEIPRDATLVIGSAFPPGRPIAPGVITGLSLRARPLSPLAIARIFEAGVPGPPVQ